MELIKISESRIKIMLDQNDMERHHLPLDLSEIESDAVRDAFWEILYEIEEESGFHRGEGEHFSVQLYPSRDGGCEMFVTRALLPEERGSFREGEHTSLPEMRGSHTSIGGTIPLSFEEAIERERRAKRRIAFGFDRLSWLLSAAKRLDSLGYTGESAAYIDENGRYYLILTPNEDKNLGALFEYGSKEDAEFLLLYMTEHGKVLSKEGAVSRLAPLAR